MISYLEDQKLIILEVIFWYIFLIDSIVYNGVAWFYVDWYKSVFPNVSGIIPINRISGLKLLILSILF